MIRRMGLGDLRKTIRERQRLEIGTEDEQSAVMQNFLTKVRDRPFYIWDSGKHKQATNLRNNPEGKGCCFNHCLPAGMPTKKGIPQPFWDYQYMIYQALTKDHYLNARLPTPEEEEKLKQINIEVEEKARSKKESVGIARSNYLKYREETLINNFKKRHLAVLKSSGMGVSEFILRFMAYLSCKNDNLKNTQMIIFTGPRLELAVSLINRIKDLFKPDITFTDKETVVNLNGVRIEAFPSHHADSARGLPNVSFIFVDEGSFIPDREKDNVLDIMLRNVPKSDPYLVVVSTPRKPGDLMDQLMSEPYDTSPFKKMTLDWTYGINKIYDKEDIDKIKNSRSFPREFCLQFSGLEGNVLSQEVIDRCISTGELLDKTAPIDDWSIQTSYVMSIDIGWGSSATAIMVSRYVNGKVQIVYSKEFANRPLFQDILDTVWSLKRKCSSNLKNILMDASATEFYTALCHEFNQNPSLQYLRDKQSWVKKVHSQLEKYLFVVPIPFNPMGKTMLNHTQRMLSEKENDGTALVGIHEQFQDLILSCRSAYASDIDVLDKERTVHADTFDALRLNLQYYGWRNK